MVRIAQDMTVSLFILLSALDLPQGVLSQVQLQESGPRLLKPSQTLSLNCAISGDSVSSTSATWNCIRQPHGRGLEWLGRTYYSSKWYNEYAPSLQGRVTPPLTHPRTSSPCS
ncbi:PREDICTED: putative V-set and immunoglobulin domain-containing-like protein IGHV4OR15-8 [Chinchilla lanigera]|uniref:putative V-set and immunoglobulin domain-containing-like protein IGHV4OR15-8 n=1 Tax=Chinchilla lanigera TaxID=34839 RepID=UPI00038EB45B|nr:PREDICTED: putative V-set and immunoglobulin domain-containing-like protein IGHV4OR15-8 [Chinchilla lanigera]